MFNDYSLGFPDYLKRYLPLHTREEIIKLLDNRPIVFAEVGARTGATAFSRLGRFIHYYGFEPDAEECQRLNEQLTKAGVYKKAQCSPVALMGVSGPVTLNCCRNPGCSSMLEPNLELLSQFGYRRMDRRFVEHFGVTGHFNCSAITLDEFTQKERLDYLDVVFLDTQGSEYEIIKSGAEILKTALVVKVEMEFIQMYKEQPLFRDVDGLLNNFGFQLLALENVNSVHRPLAGTYDRVDRGELYAADGIYCRKIDRKLVEANGSQLARTIAHMLLMDHLGFPATAVYIGEQYARYCSADPLVAQLGVALGKQYLRKNFIASLPAFPLRAYRSLRHRVSRLYHSKHPTT